LAKAEGNPAKEQANSHFILVCRTAFWYERVTLLIRLPKTILLIGMTI
jgi:hypothetical protein